jgi:hypothetical protein
VRLGGKRLHFLNAKFDAVSVINNRNRLAARYLRCDFGGLIRGTGWFWPMVAEFDLMSGRGSFLNICLLVYLRSSPYMILSSTHAN